MDKYETQSDIIKSMVGQCYTSVTADDSALTFKNEDHTIVFEHYQECCESVYIQSIAGNLSDLEGSRLLMAEQVSSDNEGRSPVDDEYEWGEVEEWTFYKFATIKGYVTVRWYGVSNGYYSTGVDVHRVKN